MEIRSRYLDCIITAHRKKQRGSGRNPSFPLDVGGERIANPHKAVQEAEKILVPLIHYGDPAIEQVHEELREEITMVERVTIDEAELYLPQPERAKFLGISPNAPAWKISAVLFGLPEDAEFWQFLTVQRLIQKFKIEERNNSVVQAMEEEAMRNLIKVLVPEMDLNISALAKIFPQENMGIVLSETNPHMPDLKKALKLKQEDDIGAVFERLNELLLVKKLGLDENVKPEIIEKTDNERIRRELAIQYGLPENADWNAIIEAEENF